MLEGTFIDKSVSLVINKDERPLTDKISFKDRCINFGISNNVTELIGDSLGYPEYEKHHIDVFHSGILGGEDMRSGRKDTIQGFQFKQKVSKYGNFGHTALIIDGRILQKIQIKNFEEISKYIGSIYSFISHDSSIHSNGLGTDRKGLIDIETLLYNLVEQRSQEMIFGKFEIIAGIAHKEIMGIINQETGIYSRLRTLTIDYRTFLDSIQLSNDIYYYFLKIYAEALFTLISSESKLGKELASVLKINSDVSRFGNIIHNTKLKGGIGGNHIELLDYLSAYNEDVKNFYLEALSQGKTINDYSLIGQPTALKKLIKV